MKAGKSKPITPTEAALILLYVLIALSRQVARDLRTLGRIIGIK